MTRKKSIPNGKGRSATPFHVQHQRRPNEAAHHADHLPTLWIGVVVVPVVVVLALVLWLPSWTRKVQVVAHSDFVSFGLGSPAHLPRLRVRELKVTGVSQIQTPYGTADVSPAAHLAVVFARAPANATEPGANAYQLALDMVVAAGSKLFFAREGAGGAYRVGVSRTAAALDTTLARGQAIAIQASASNLVSADDQELPVTFIAAASPGLMFHMRLEGEAPFLPPFTVDELDFLEPVPLRSGEIAGLTSRLVSADVAWVDIPGKTKKLAQGDTLILKRPYGRLAGLSLGVTDVAMTFGGTVEAATLAVAGVESSLVPSMWDWLMDSPWGHLIVGAVSISTTAIGIAQWMRRRRQIRTQPKVVPK